MRSLYLHLTIRHEVCFHAQAANRHFCPQAVMFTFQCQRRFTEPCRRRHESCCVMTPLCHRLPNKVHLRSKPRRGQKNQTNLELLTLSGLNHLNLLPWRWFGRQRRRRVVLLNMRPSFSSTSSMAGVLMSLTPPGAPLQTQQKGLDRVELVKSRTYLHIRIINSD